LHSGGEKSGTFDGVTDVEKIAEGREK